MLAFPLVGPLSWFIWGRTSTMTNSAGLRVGPESRAPSSNPGQDSRKARCEPGLIWSKYGARYWD
ncbi:hypothetical protein [Nocardia sp. NBC_00511]|uniref:hypothetical protein n=1 Tax=Nocardia sp. NBC_00511 TaxID=2903591 RepID=UPI0038635788